MTQKQFAAYRALYGVYIVAEFHQKNGNYRKLQVAEVAFLHHPGRRLRPGGNFAIAADSSGVIFPGIFAAAVSTDSERCVFIQVFA